MTPPAIAEPCQPRTIRRNNPQDDGRENMAKSVKKTTAKKTEPAAEVELPLVAQVKRAIDESGMSRNAVSLKAQVSASIVEKFMNGKSGITLATAAKILNVLGYSLKKD